VRVLAVASSGGHWIQLRRLRPAWEGCDVAYATTHAGYRAELREDATPSGEAPRFYSVVDANRWQRLRLLRLLFQIALLLLRERPDVVVSTGAAPGYLALRLGKLLGARTVWVDSLANAEELSLSGRLAGSCADLWLTQWEDLAGSVDRLRGLPRFEGTVASSF
jgi:UDP-N-acetylglucosamine:LPS N-acetylglucosamine transferase